ncbi:Hypothetical protein CINCED_3A025633 [Cinara cedri]|uniref:Myb/SANT-like DNA-binding domain-containing protein n=1 Tax=Cinara cedri TaxID=506608 RepID=A0A5E4M768_9HEMI|nr:Hypothetical protein CINCED_3A025633 [Cinara cedri]
MTGNWCREEINHLLKFCRDADIISTPNLYEREDIFKELSKYMWITFGYIKTAEECKEQLKTLEKNFQSYKNVLPFMKEMNILMSMQIKRRRKNDSNINATMRRRTRSSYKMSKDKDDELSNKDSDSDDLDSGDLDSDDSAIKNPRLIPILMRQHTIVNDKKEANQQNKLIAGTSSRTEEPQQSTSSNFAASFNQLVVSKNVIDSITELNDKTIQYLIRIIRKSAMDTMDIVCQLHDS